MKNNRFINRHYRQVLPMALLIAWFWCLPLFGPLQAEIPVADEKLLPFSLFFLFGMVAGHLLMMGDLPLRYGNRIPKTCFGILLAGMGILLTGFSEMFLVSVIPLIMGLAGGGYFVFWGVSIYHIEAGEKGRYMGLMMVVASLFQAGVLSLYAANPALGLWLLAALLVAALFTSGWQGFSSEVRPDTKKNYGKDGLKRFWMPFALLLICYYILSWITHNSFYPYILESSAIAIFGVRYFMEPPSGWPVAFWTGSSISII